jgi:hypothetical protein
MYKWLKIIFFYLIGVSHADDIYLIMENIYFNPKSTNDKAMQSDLLNFVVSVATNGYVHFKNNIIKRIKEQFNIQIKILVHQILE